MTELSRRVFLQLCGASLAGAALPFDRAESAAFHGRVFDEAHIHAGPAMSAPVLETAAADQVIALEAFNKRWARAETGFVHLHDVQPAALYARPVVLDEMPAGGAFWVEVITPLTMPRRWPSPGAPLLEPVYYGAALRVVDVQGDDWKSVWYRSDHGMWLQALHGRPLDTRRRFSPAGGGILRLNLSRCRLTALAGERTALVAPIAPGEGIEAMVGMSFPVVAKRVAIPGLPAWEGANAGLPWFIKTSGQLSIVGTYLHNRFGEPLCSGPVRFVTVPPAVGRWLYRWVEVGRTRVEVVSV